MAPRCFTALWRLRRRSPLSNSAVAGRSNANDHFLVPTEADNPVPALTGATHSGSSMSTPALVAGTATRPPSPQGDAEDVVPASSAGVPTETTYRLDASQAKKNVGRIRRFRVLVMGRANAGKTTILQRVCNTTDQPEIFDAEGRMVDAAVVEGTHMRGHHNIENELIFGSNSRFVFHDSCGFEAGSETQFQKMKEFVIQHATTPNLQQRIHAIWFCIPLNESHRMVTAAESKFFEECDTGHVPVIVVLTKADALELDAWEELMDRELSEDEALQEVAKVEREMCDRHFRKVKEWLQASRFPPHDFQLLKGMDDEGADCTALIECTANALNEESLQKLLISTQQSSLGLCIEYAIMKALRKCMEYGFGFQEPTKLGAVLSTWFPYADSNYGQDSGIGNVGLDYLLHSGSYRVDHDRSQYGGRLTEFELESDPHLVPLITRPSKPFLMPPLSTSMQSPMMYVVEHGIGSILVFEYMYFSLQVNPEEQDVEKHFKMAVKEYQTSGVQDKVTACIAVAFQEHGENVEALCPILVDIAKENQMSKKLIG